MIALHPSPSLPLLFGPVMSPWSMLILLVIVFLVFGNKLPDLARNFGKGISEFKKGLKEGDEEDSDKKQLPKSEDKSS